MDHCRHRARKIARRLGPVIALDGARKEIDLFCAGRVDGEIDEPALDFRPLVAHLAGESVRVFLKRLMEDAYDQKAPIAARCRFGELLEDIDVRTVLRRGFKELAHLID